MEQIFIIDSQRCHRGHLENFNHLVDHYNLTIPGRSKSGQWSLCQPWSMPLLLIITVINNNINIIITIHTAVSQLSSVSFHIHPARCCLKARSLISTQETFPTLLLSWYCHDNDDYDDDSQDDNAGAGNWNGFDSQEWVGEFVTLGSGEGSGSGEQSGSGSGEEPWDE